MQTQPVYGHACPMYTHTHANPIPNYGHVCPTYTHMQINPQAAALPRGGAPRRDLRPYAGAQPTRTPGQGGGAG